MMKQLLAALVIVVLLVLIWLGWGPRPHWPKPLSDLQVAEGWLHCIDCQGPFLKQLANMPARNQDTVTKFLRSALLLGPDQKRAVQVRRDFEQAWRADSLSRQRRGVPAGSSLVDFLQRYERGFEVRWRSRAAVALSVIGTQQARSALQDGLGLPLQDKGDSIVRNWVEKSIADSSTHAAVGHYP